MVTDELLKKPWHVHLKDVGEEMKLIKQVSEQLVSPLSDSMSLLATAKVNTLQEFVDIAYLSQYPVRKKDTEKSPFLHSYHLVRAEAMMHKAS